jgi:hypothetical protein
LLFEKIANREKTRPLTGERLLLSQFGRTCSDTHLSERFLSDDRGWTSADEVEIKGESGVTINDDQGDEFTFTALVSKSGRVKHLTVVPTR